MSAAEVSDKFVHNWSKRADQPPGMSVEATAFSVSIWKAWEGVTNRYALRPTEPVVRGRWAALFFIGLTGSQHPHKWGRREAVILIKLLQIILENADKFSEKRVLLFVVKNNHAEK